MGKAGIRKAPECSKSLSVLEIMGNLELLISRRSTQTHMFVASRGDLLLHWRTWLESETTHIQG